MSQRIHVKYCTKKAQKACQLIGKRLSSQQKWTEKASINFFYKLSFVLQYHGRTRVQTKLKANCKKCNSDFFLFQDGSFLDPLLHFKQKKTFVFHFEVSYYGILSWNTTLKLKFKKQQQVFYFYFKIWFSTKFKK